MEKINGKTHARQARDRELLTMFNNVLDEMLSAGVPNAWDAALRFTISHGTPHYHVSFDRAYRVVSAIVLHGDCPLQENNHREMWREIAERVSALMAVGGLSVARSVDIVLRECRASRFFISEPYARRHIYRARHESRRHFAR